MTQTMQIRIAREQDAPALLDIYTPYVTETAITFEYETPSPEEFSGRIHNTLQRYPYLVAEADGVILGYAYAGTFKARAAYDWSVETTVYVRHDCKRCGVGRKLYDALETLLREQGVRNLNACIAVPETQDEHLTWDSVYFHERLGFVPVGTFHGCGCKFGRWYNMIWMEKMIGSHTPDPEPIRLFPEIRADAEQTLTR